MKFLLITYPDTQQGLINVDAIATISPSIDVTTDDTITIVLKNGVAIDIKADFDTLYSALCSTATVDDCRWEEPEEEIDEVVE